MRESALSVSSSKDNVTNKINKLLPTGHPFDNASNDV